MKEHTQAEWDALDMSDAKVEQKKRKLGGSLVALRRGYHVNDEVTGHGCGKETEGPMKGSFGIYTFYKRSSGTEYYVFTNPPG